MTKGDRFFRAAGLMAVTSVLVPVVGVATAPILAHGLGVAGRGEVAAAVAPNVLIAGAATFGLPDALTYFLAKSPHRTRPAIAVCVLISIAIGAASFLAVLFSAEFLAGGVPDLAMLILIATALAIPQLVVNLLRGAAIGRQMWTTVAIERVLNSVLRLLLLLLLLVLGRLDVLSAVLITAGGPVLAGLVYWRLLRAAPAADSSSPPVTTGALVGFGGRIWLGSVAATAMSRLGPLLVTPLSDVRQLGLLAVATTISDVPFIVGTSVRDVLFGADSAERDATRLALATRLSTSMALAGSIVLGATLPFWIEVAFGRGFSAALPATWVLLLSVSVNVPGWMAGAGLSAWGRPELRSVGLVVALVVNLVGLLVLVPPLGALGAALAALGGALALTGYTIVSTSSTVGVRRRDLVVLQRGDAVLVGRTVRTVLRRRRPMRSDADARRAVAAAESEPPPGA